MSKVSRRTFMKIAAALTASGVLSWKADKLEVEAKEIAPVIGKHPFAPYEVDRTKPVYDPGALQGDFAFADITEDLMVWVGTSAGSNDLGLFVGRRGNGGVWGMPDERED